MLGTRKKIGECEGTCGKVNIEIFPVHHNMWLCADCKALEDAAIATAKQVSSLVDISREVDSKINLDTEVYQAKTVASIELRASIDANESIPESDKEFAFAQVCKERFLQFRSAVVPELRQALTQAENEMRMWQVNAQTSAGKLSIKLREQFKELDINYTPTHAPKAKIAKAAKTGGKKSKKSDDSKFNANELNDVAKKYGFARPAIRSIMITRKVNAEAAAKILAEMIAN